MSAVFDASGAVDETTATASGSHTRTSVSFTMPPDVTRGRSQRRFSPKVSVVTPSPSAPAAAEAMPPSPPAGMPGAGVKLNSPSTTRTS